MYDLNKPAFDRFIHYRQTTKVGKKQQLIPMSKRAKTILENKMRKHPEYAQSAMVSRAIENNWETVWPQGTLDQDSELTPPKEFVPPPDYLKEDLTKINKAKPEVKKASIDECLRKLYGKG